MKSPPEFEFLDDDRVQQELLLPKVMEESPDMYRWRALWRRLFIKVVPPWLDKATVESPGPYAVKSMLVGALCPVCNRPLYMAQKGITCAGGHSEQQRNKAEKKNAKKTLDGPVQTNVSEDFEIPDDDDGFFD
jgi:hypothetical protein